MGGVDGTESARGVVVRGVDDGLGRVIGGDFCRTMVEDSLNRVVPDED